MNKIEKGMLAISLAGHDLRKLYMVVDFDETYVYLSDEKLKMISNPKRKKYKHVQLIKSIPKAVRSSFENDSKPEDILIARIIKECGDRFK